MIENRVSICQKHQKKTITLKKGEESSDLGYCSVCLSDLLIKFKWEKTHQIMINVVQNEDIRMRHKKRTMTRYVDDISIKRLDDSVILVGPVVNGQKHGEYYYVFDDGTKRKAGLFDKNNKQGDWCDFVSFKYEIFNDDDETYHSSYEEKIITGTKIRRMKYSYYQQGIQIKTQINYERRKLNQYDEIKDGGDYNKKGEKSGQWIESSDKYHGLLKVKYKGEYKRGKRIGNWIIFDQWKKIGGGNYDEDGLKTGYWIDLNDSYWHCCQQIQQGEYMSGLRIQQWEIKSIFSEEIDKKFENLEIKYRNNMGGFYNDQGMKQGLWTELHENYSSYCSVTYQGEYWNDIKIGKWIIKESDSQIGGGNYDQYGQKQGQWTEIHDQYYCYSQVIQQGEYKNGIKIGKWKYIYEGQEIGGGTFDELGLKQGQWIDPEGKNYNWNKITYKGEYKNGTRIGQWIEKKDNKTIVMKQLGQQ